MTRRDFANLAQVLGRGFRDAGLTARQRTAVLDELCPALRAANSRFDTTRFVEAVGAASDGEKVPYSTV